MIIISSWNGRVSINEAMEALKAGGSAVDAVEVGIRGVEANPEDHTVGYGGYPNLLGQVELDAAIMDGRDLTGGAVAAIRGYKHPISIARKVMEELPHVLLAGQGAERFAAEMGFEQEALLTDAAREVWQRRLKRDMPEKVLAHLTEQPDLSHWVRLATDPERAGGTVNFIAQDAQGHLCAGVSTSGWAWKYPGRVGDSPLIGAGLYAHDRYGAAACTGMGEMAIRAGTAHSLVLYLRQGLPVEEAGRQAIADLNDLGGRFRSHLNFILLDQEGRHAGFSTAQNRTYLYLTPEMAEPEEPALTCIPISQRWGE